MGSKLHWAPLPKSWILSWTLNDSLVKSMIFFSLQWSTLIGFQTGKSQIPDSKIVNSKFYSQQHNQRSWLSPLLCAKKSCIIEKKIFLVSWGARLPIHTGREHVELQAILLMLLASSVNTPIHRFHLLALAPGVQCGLTFWHNCVFMTAGTLKTDKGSSLVPADSTRLFCCAEDKERGCVTDVLQDCSEIPEHPGLWRILPGEDRLLLNLRNSVHQRDFLLKSSL